MRTREVRSRWLLAAVVAAGLLVAAAAISDAAEPVVLGQVTFRNIKALVDKSAKVAEKAWPGGGVFVNEAAAQMLDENVLGGVDWTKPITLVFLSGKEFGKKEPTVVAVLPLLDAKKFGEAAKAAGIGKIDLQGNLAIVSEDEGAIKFVTPQRLLGYSAFPAEAGTADIAASFTVGQSLEEYMDEISEGILRLEEQVGGLGNIGPGAFLVKAVKAFRPLVKLAAKQVKSAGLNVQLNENSIDLKWRMTAAEGTELATFIASQPAGGSDLVKYLPPEAVAGLAAKMDWMKLQPFANAIIGSLAGPLDLKADMQQKFTQMMFGSTATGEFVQIVASGAGHEGMQVVQVSKIGDPEKLRTAMKETMEWMAGGLSSLFETAGVKMKVDYKANIRQYKDVPVDQITVSFEQEQGGANPFAGQMPPQVSQVAAFDTFAVTASQNPKGDLLDAAIDRIKGGGAGLDTNAAYQRAKAAAPQGANIVGFALFNSLLAKFIEQAAKQQPMIALIAGGIAQADPTEEPITAYTVFNKDTLEEGIRIPHQPIVTFATRIRHLKEQFEQQPGFGPPRKAQPKGQPKAPTKRPNIDEF